MYLVRKLVERSLRSDRAREIPRGSSATHRLYAMYTGEARAGDETDVSSRNMYKYDVRYKKIGCAFFWRFRQINSRCQRHAVALKIIERNTTKFERFYLDRYVAFTAAVQVLRRKRICGDKSSPQLRKSGFHKFS